MRARYGGQLDAKAWVAWRDVVDDDFASDTSQSMGEVISGAAAFVARTRRQISKRPQPTVHQVLLPQIELISATTATGRRLE